MGASVFKVMLNNVFSGQVAVVTGASRGIGRAIALEFARQGANVAFGYLRNHTSARQTTEEIESYGVRCLSAQAHVGDPDSITRFFQLVSDTFGEMQILINNAASGIQRAALDLDTKHWDWAMNINARGAWLCACLLYTSDAAAE